MDPSAKSLRIEEEEEEKEQEEEEEKGGNTKRRQHDRKASQPPNPRVPVLVSPMVRFTFMWVQNFSIYVTIFLLSPPA